MTTNPTPEPTKPAADMAVEAIRIVKKTSCVSVHQDNTVLGSFTGPDGPRHAQLFSDALRAALARPLEVAGVTTKTDLARIWREVNGGNRWPSDVDAFVNAVLAASRAPVAVGVEPEALGKTCIDGGKCHHECAARCFRRECCAPLTASGLTMAQWQYPVAGAGGSVGAEPASSEVGNWGLDTSTGTPILVHKNCSVIESEQARYVLGLIAADQVASVPLGGGEVERLKACLKWYADGQHFILDDDWDTVSGEPQNWLNGPESGMVEDGGVARMALDGGYMVEGDGEITIELPLSEEQHTSKLARIQELMGRNPAADSADGLELSHLAGQVERHEKRVYPLQAQDAAPVGELAHEVSDSEVDRFTDIVLGNSEAIEEGNGFIKPALEDFLQRRAPPAGVQGDAAREPDMFWDAEDGETFGHCIEEVIECLSEGEEMLLDCAIRQPQIRVRAKAGNEYEIVDKARAQSTKGA